MFCENRQVVLAAALRSDKAPRTAVGVELVQARHDVGVRALERCDKSVRDKTHLVCGDALIHDARETTKAFLCNATFGQALTDEFATALCPWRAPLLERVATLATFSDSALQKNDLSLVEVSAVAGNWCPSGTALFVYGRSGGGEKATPTGTTTSPTVHQEMLDQMLRDRREAAVRSHATGAATEGEAERGLLRTAVMASVIAAIGSSRDE